MERAITLSDDEKIDLAHLQTAPLRSAFVSPSPAVSSSDDAEQPQATSPSIGSKKLPAEGLERYLENIEKEVLLNALNITHWNRTLAAKKLGMTFRSLRYRLKKFGLDTEDDE